MSIVEKEESASEQLLNMSSLFTPWALRVAASLGLADKICDGANNAEELARLTGSHPDSLARVMRHLVNIGVLAVDTSGQFSLTDLGKVLRSDHPSRLVQILDQNDPLIQAIDEATPGIVGCVKSGTPAWASYHGADFWSYLSSNSSLSGTFDNTMEIQGKRVGEELAATYDWQSIGRVADIGGGVGVILGSLLRSNLSLLGMLVDLPITVSRAEIRLKSLGLANRVELYGRSFFDELPAGADVFLLSHVLHDWPDNKSAEILARCKEASPPHGRILVVERLVADLGEESSLSVSNRDLAVMVILGSRERSEEEFRLLGESVGLVLSRVRPLIVEQSVFLLEFLPTDK
ncbi:methyltransferase [Parafrankia sp. FMc6]|uniref:methyltransferase n=1 Tax=Parafrankia soli TaxID=2599596 RepID=UPI0034D696A6